MKLLIIGGSNSRNSGGVFDAARMLGLGLYEHNKVEVEYLMFDDEYSAEDKKYYNPLPVHSYTVKGPRKLGLSPDIYRRIEDIRPDIVHTQSLWTYLSFANKKYHEKTGTPYLISPHGMLDRWQLKQSFWKDLKKNIVLHLYERQHLENAACLHALCREEHDAIRSLGLRNPVAIIPNGINLPGDHYRAAQPNNHTDNSSGNFRKKLLFLGRLHKKKGLENLLEAWAILGNEHNWQLVIAGETKDKAYLQLLMDKTIELNIVRTVSFAGGLFGEAKQECLRSSDAFILPSFSEGLPLSVLEAWSYQLPVIITPFCNLPEGFERNAAIQIDTNPPAIAEGIRKVIFMREAELSQIGQCGFELVREKFSWCQVANSMAEVYNWILGKTKRPAFVFA